MTEQSKLMTAIAVATVVIFGGLTFALLRAPSDRITPTGTIAFNDMNSVATGKLDAPVVVRLYSDFQCPACRAVDGAIRTIIQEYSDRVKFVWKDFPLLAIHPNARNSANAARCANDQGTFWEFHNRLYDNQDVWAPLSDPKERFVQFARDAGLNADQFTSCYSDKKFDRQVMEDVTEGEKNGIKATPTFFINNAPTQARSESQWRVALDAALQKANTPAPAPAAATSTQ